MRPPQLDQLFIPISTLSGVGPKILPLLSSLLGIDDKASEARLVDLLFHLPHSLIDRRYRPPIHGLKSGEIATLEVVVEAHKPPPRGRSHLPYRVCVGNDTGVLDLVYFHAKGDWLSRQLPVGSRRIISGRTDCFHGKWQMAHPDYVIQPEKLNTLPLIEPVYPLTLGISNRVMIKLVRQALDRLAALPEWLDQAILERHQWPGFIEALNCVHRPKDPEVWAPQAAARSRLAYDEFLAGQLGLNIVRAEAIKTKGRAVAVDRILSKNVRALMPFQLTGAQEKAIAEIREDLFSEKRMLRLLQGDVGSGKTMVAFFAALVIIEAGYQAAIMAPTEVLSRQHYETLKPYIDALGLSIALLTGRDRSQGRKSLLTSLANGDIDLVVGTQALFQADVHYQNLGLVIIDEQHRFGVHQRLALSAKGERVDMLVMTATPIPRTLMLAHFGDMAVSVIDEKPAGRQPVNTIALPAERINDVLLRLSALMQKDERAYWICPLVETSEALDAVSAEARFESLTERFGDKVGLVHGRMSAQEKGHIIKQFQSGTIHTLVATTVVEVGVDVPEATVMIIEHAERFGLAQLHQLRGRVGRSDKLSHCLLLYQGPLSETAHKRLNIMRETNDGFRIAEVDLQLRGGGELLGARQSGLPDFKLAMIEHHADFLSEAYQAAKTCLDSNKPLNKRLSEAQRILLYLFRYDDAIRLVRAG